MKKHKHKLFLIQRTCIGICKEGLQFEDRMYCLDCKKTKLKVTTKKL